MKAKRSILILYATQTGSAEQLAENTSDFLQEKGYTITFKDVFECSVELLKEYPIILLFASTWGEGEPPDDALDFFESLKESESLDLTHAHCAVFGLGDSSYEFFNQCAKDFEAMFFERGASQLLARVDADIDYEEPFEKWLPELERALESKEL